MSAYYNEIDPYAAQWLRNLISKNFIAPGDVDERSIVDVHADDLKGYDQCHFFAGIGGWSLAARLAGWPDDRPLWTGSCPCQPFSVAGKGEGSQDERHLWPIFFGLIRSRNPSVVMGEQVAAAVGKDWLDGVHSDLESINYTCGAAVVPACAVDAPHRRDRLWFVANSQRERRERWEGTEDRDVHDRQDARRIEGHSRPTSLSEDDPCGRSDVADTSGTRVRGRGPGEDVGQAGEREGEGAQRERVRAYDRNAGNSTPWSSDSLIVGADGKTRRIEPSIRLLAHGIPARVGKLRAYGNAIVPQVAAEVIGAYLDLHPDSPFGWPAPSFDPLHGPAELPMEQGNGK